MRQVIDIFNFGSAHVATIVGFLWLGVILLVTGFIGEAFSMRLQAMLSGINFMSDQVGSFMAVLEVAWCLTPWACTTGPCRWAFAWAC